jgi:hypothetical protein
VSEERKNKNIVENFFDLLKEITELRFQGRPRTTFQQGQNWICDEQQP